jgi:hypothetical protein
MQRDRGWIYGKLFEAVIVCGLLTVCSSGCSVIKEFSIDTLRSRERGIDLPLCTCFPEYESVDRNEIDLDPSVSKYNKVGILLRRPDGPSIAVYYTTQTQLYEYLQSLPPGVCLATSFRAGCMSGGVVVTEDVEGQIESRVSGGPPCDFPTEEVSPVSTPIINYIHCTARPRDPDETPYVPTATPTFTP